MDRWRNPERLRYAVPWGMSPWMNTESTMSNLCYRKHTSEGYTCIKITLASRLQHMKSDSRKLHINKNKNDYNLIVVFQYLHIIVKIDRIVINLDTLLLLLHCPNVFVLFYVPTYMSYASPCKIYNTTNTWCAYLLYIKNLALYSIRCFFDHPILHFTIVIENEWINYE